MDLRVSLRSMLWGMILSAICPAAWAGGPRKVEPSEVLPFFQIAPQYRDSITEIIRDHSFRRVGKAETFPCNPRLYLKLLNEPVLTLGLWHDLSPTTARLDQVGPNRFQGTDGSGTTASWEFVLRSPRLHVMLCDLEYTGPRGHTKLNGRIVLIVRSGFFREVNGDFWVQHEIEAFVKIDSKGWKAVAATVRPLIEKLLEDQIQEAGWFVSLMGRLVEAYPTWATQVAACQPGLSDEAKTTFRELVAQTKRPGAFTGRPTLADTTTTATNNTSTRTR